jgi:outer membrane protein assembly factor BamE (lipoprotein component of BamABCDE complex)
MRSIWNGCLVITALGLAGCAIQRAQLANDAQSEMVGMTKEQVLSCMGPPANKAAEGATEVWSYPSGNGQTSVSTFATGGGRFASGFGVAEQRFCTINVTMNGGRVSRMNYVGPTGGLLTQGEQCAFAVQNCVQAR